MTREEKKLLLNYTRRAIEGVFEGITQIEVDENALSEKTKEKGATFVTLTIDGKLRGCIGKLVAVNPMYKDIVENAVSAAFGDYRFSHLSKDELKKVNIEISILSKAEELKYKDGKDLLKKLEDEKPGVIIEKGQNTATFLPQVWEDLTVPEDFLSNLCVKAGLSSEEWKNGDLKVRRYKVEKFKEDDI